MDEDFLAYIDYCITHAEHAHDSLIWGEDMGNWQVDNNAKQTIFEKFKDEPLEEIPY